MFILKYTQVIQNIHCETILLRGIIGIIFYINKKVLSMPLNILLDLNINSSITMLKKIESANVNKFFRNIVRISNQIVY